MKYLSILLFFISTIAVAQNNRVQIKGTISSTIEGPLLGITVFNKNSLEGTITNDEGVFFIETRAGDELLFKALQFETITLKISKNIIEEKEISLGLKEDIKQLEVVNVSNGESMMIQVKRLVEVDAQLDKVSVRNINTRAVDRMEYTFSDRIKQPDEYAVQHKAAYQSAARFNMVGLSTQINMSNVSRALDPANLSNDNDIPEEESPIALLKNKYQKSFLMDLLKIPEEKLPAFYYYAAESGLTKGMILDDNPLILLDFLTVNGEKFRKQNNLPND